MVKRITLLLAVLMLILVGTSALAKVYAPDWANSYGVINIQKCALYQYFELNQHGFQGEERLGSMLSGVAGGTGMMLQKKYDFVFEGDKVYGEVEDKDIGKVLPEFKGIRKYDFTVTPESIKGDIKYKYSPKRLTFDLSFVDNKLVGTVNNKKKIFLKYDLAFGEDGSINGTIGYKGNVHKVAFQKYEGAEVKGTIKGDKRFGYGPYTLEYDFMVPPSLEREKLSFIFFILLHQEFITDFDRNVDFDMPY